MKQKIYAVLHCESCYNRDGIFTGRVDSVLTESGHIHAQVLAQKLAQVEFTTAYRSSLTRSKQTLDHILVYHPDTTLVVDDRLIERDYGKLSHLKKKKFQKEHPDLYPIYHRAYDVAPPGGESIKQVEKRVYSFIADLLKQMKESGKNTLIVGHSNAMRPFRQFFEQLTIEEMMKLENKRDEIFTYEISVSQKLKEIQLLINRE